MGRMSDGTLSLNHNMEFSTICRLNISQWYRLPSAEKPRALSHFFSAPLLCLPLSTKADGPAAAESCLFYPPHPCSLSPCPRQEYWSGVPLPSQINQATKDQTQRANIKSSKGKTTNNTQWDSHKDNSWSFNRNFSGQKVIARHT